MALSKIQVVLVASMLGSSLITSPQTDSQRRTIEVSMGLEGEVVRHGHVTAKTGDEIPSITLHATSARDVDLRKQAQEHSLVLFFYPGDLEGIRYPELAGCTPQACAFRDSIDEFRKLGAQVFGVNLHTTARQQSFVDREHLNFELLSDEARELTQAFGIPVWISNSGEEFVDRVTILVRQGGRIAKVFQDVKVEGHIKEVLEALRHPE